MTEYYITLKDLCNEMYQEDEEISTASLEHYYSEQSTRLKEIFDGLGVDNSVLKKLRAYQIPISKITFKNGPAKP